MSIRTTSIETFESELETTTEKRSQFGEIFTPFSLIDDMLDLIPAEAFTNPDAKWLDPGAGRGQFSAALFWRLDKGLDRVFPDTTSRHDHILSSMLYMVEIQEDNVARLRLLFGEEANIVATDFTHWSAPFLFDHVIGNPPYNRDGFKKTPTNLFQKKKDDGETIWQTFVKRAISLLKPQGGLLFIVPSIWMRPDKARMYHHIGQYQIERLHALGASETNRVFGGVAQTPTCYFYLTNRPSEHPPLLAEGGDTYTPFKLRGNVPIPVFGAAFINCFRPFVDHYGAVVAKKTNMPRRGSMFARVGSDIYTYPNIVTATLDGLSPKLVVNHSTTPQAYHGVPKLVLPHKMYGFPFFDREGVYGISNRDNYVIFDYSLEELELFREFLSTKTALYLFECTRYRMRYLEKEAFLFVPNLAKLPDLPRPLTDVSLAAYFGFSLAAVESFHCKDYTFCYVE